MHFPFTLDFAHAHQQFASTTEVRRVSSVVKLCMAKAEQTPEYDGVVCVGGLVPSRAAERVEILQFNTRNFGVGLEVKGNIIRYIGNGSHSTDVGAIQTSKPVQSRGAVYYYEITILEMGERGCISLGFADSAFKLNRQCG